VKIGGAAGARSGRGVLRGRRLFAAPSAWQQEGTGWRGLRSGCSSLQQGAGSEVVQVGVLGCVWTSGMVAQATGGVTSRIGMVQTGVSRWNAPVSSSAASPAATPWMPYRNHLRMIVPSVACAKARKVRLKGGSHSP